MEDIEQYRVEIDNIDKQMTELLEKRMELSKLISIYKKERGLPIFNEERERKVIEKNKNHLKNRQYENVLESYYENLMYLSRLVQQNHIYGKEEVYTEAYKNDREGLIVGYQGVEGSFSNEATVKYFKNIKESKSYEKFEDVFKAVETGEIEYGVLPVENSSTGGIGTVEDLLNKYNLYIVGEECIKISQNLVGIKGATTEDIKDVYSHPQGFEQSKGFLDQYKNYNLIPFSNTAISAKLVSKLNDKSKAAIASTRAAKLYDLNIIKKDVNDLDNNHTRFIIIGRHLECSEKCDKISIIFSIEDVSGGLYTIIRDIKEFGLNMSKIESRPNRNTSWNYIFFVDFDGNLADDNVKKAINTITRNSKYFKLLGCYKKKI